MGEYWLPDVGMPVMQFLKLRAFQEHVSHNRGDRRSIVAFCFHRDMEYPCCACARPVAAVAVEGCDVFRTELEESSSCLQWALLRGGAVALEGLF